MPITISIYMKNGGDCRNCRIQGDRFFIDINNIEGNNCVHTWTTALPFCEKSLFRRISGNVGRCICIVGITAYISDRF